MSFTARLTENAPSSMVASALRLRLRGLRGGVLADDPLALFDEQKLIRGDVGDTVLLAAGPLDFDGRHRCVLAQAERQREVALRAVARAAADHAPLLAAGAVDAYHRADAI